MSLLTSNWPLRHPSFFWTLFSDCEKRRERRKKKCSLSINHFLKRIETTKKVDYRLFHLAIVYAINLQWNYGVRFKNVQKIHLPLNDKHKIRITKCSSSTRFVRVFFSVWLFLFACTMQIVVAVLKLKTAWEFQSKEDESSKNGEKWIPK